MLKNKKCQALLIAASAFIGINGSVYGSNWRMSGGAFNSFERTKHLLYGGSHVATSHETPKKYSVHTHIERDNVKPFGLKIDKMQYTRQEIRDIVLKYDTSYNDLITSVLNFDKKHNDFFGSESDKSLSNWCSQILPLQKDVLLKLTAARGVLLIYASKVYDYIPYDLQETYTQSKSRLETTCNSIEGLSKALYAIVKGNSSELSKFAFGYSKALLLKE